MELLKDKPTYGQLSVISMKGCEEITDKIDWYLRQFRSEYDNAETYITHIKCPRFGSGEAKCVITETVRGHDVYIVCDPFNYSVTYNMYGKQVPMSPDDHYADLKRIVAAIAGKARRITVIMPMLYEGRQHKKSTRESLDCAVMLQELVNMGIHNIVTFDAHDPRVCNAIPLHGFDNVRPSYQMIKALIKAVPDIVIDKENLIMISPDEGAMGRCMYYSSVLGIDIGMFYKRRNYSVIINGKNPIEAHEYLGQDLTDKDVIVVDDMISSGESMLDVCSQLKARGAKRIFVFSTFGLFTDGFEKFDKAYEDGLISKVFTTNLVYRRPGLLEKPWHVDVNMCKYVSYIIDTLNHDATISELLDPAKRINAIVAKHRAAMESKK